MVEIRQTAVITGSKMVGRKTGNLNAFAKIGLFEHVPSFDPAMLTQRWPSTDRALDLASRGSLMYKAETLPILSIFSVKEGSPACSWPPKVS